MFFLHPLQLLQLLHHLLHILISVHLRWNSKSLVEASLTNHHFLVYSSWVYYFHHLSCLCLLSLKGFIFQTVTRLNFIMLRLVYLGRHPFFPFRCILMPTTLTNGTFSPCCILVSSSPSDPAALLDDLTPPNNRSSHPLLLPSLPKPLFFLLFLIIAH